MGKGLERLEDKVSKMDTKLSNKTRRLGGEQLTQTSGQKAFDVQRVGRDGVHVIVFFYLFGVLRRDGGLVSAEGICRRTGTARAQQ